MRIKLSERNQGTVYDACEARRLGHKKHKPITEQLVLLPLKASSVGIAFGCKKKMSKAVCLQDIEDAAHKVLPKNALDYYKSGAEQQSTLHDNRRAFQRQALKVPSQNRASIKYVARAGIDSYRRSSMMCPRVISVRPSSAADKEPRCRSGSRRRRCRSSVFCKGNLSIRTLFFILQAL